MPDTFPLAASKDQRPAGAPSSFAASDTLGAVDSADLLRGQKAVAISHNGSTYRLQATRQGKLILTK